MPGLDKTPSERGRVMSASDEVIRVLLAGDCPLLRSGFRQVLEAAGMTVVGSVDSAADAAALLETTAADVVVVGTVTSHGSGADVVEIREAQPSIPLLVLGRSGDAAACRTGAAACEAASSGLRYISPDARLRTA